jgi:ADP-ribose pyrophosphatase YjhB (NUDIX family)/O-acetyl-ADP-ribose deacetylase (regulator of RNase III)
MSARNPPSTSVGEATVKIRGVEIEVVRAEPASVHAEITLMDEAAGAHPDEQSVRAACARALVEARVRGVGSVAIAALGVGSGGMSAVTSGKIMAQEAIRFARAGSTRTSRITFCCTGENDYPVFQKTVSGYVKHFLDVLIWGPFLTVDAIIEVPEGIVLVKRSNPPLGFALPGGFVDYGESLEQAVVREAREETGLELLDLAQFHTYSDPARDPRFHTVTTVFSARSEGVPHAGDDAADVRVMRPADLEGLPFAFDHKKVLQDWIAGLRPLPPPTVPPEGKGRRRRGTPG